MQLTADSSQLLTEKMRTYPKPVARLDASDIGQQRRHMDCIYSLALLPKLSSHLWHPRPVGREIMRCACVGRMNCSEQAEHQTAST